MNPSFLLDIVEALAIAIAARDGRSPSHIRRVRAYASGIARAMGMSEDEIHGIELAATLHDIGKLAVPDHVLLKPGPLTPEEFQKIRAHSQVGADILGGLALPYPVAALICCHHERWDGRGYPSGLVGEQIPPGARILAVVDYFEALQAARPYHAAMTEDDAVALLRQEAGLALDPAIVKTFVERLPSLRREVEVLGAAAPSFPSSVFDAIAAANWELRVLYEIAESMGAGVGVADTMAIIASKLAALIPFSSIALFLFDEESESLKCRFASGVDADILQRVVVKTGEGLTGWVARNCRALVNARPSADLEAAGISDATTILQSALVCPLLFNERLVGTISVYHVDPAFYGDDHRRLLDRVSEQAAAVINNSLLFEQTQEDALTDALTGLPNTRFLFMHLTRELARAERLTCELAMLVMDMDDFRYLKDTFGRFAGDRALCEVARVLRTTIRPYDIAVRYDRDEFIIVLSGSGADEAAAKSLEIQQALERRHFEAHRGQRVPLRISIGCAVYPGDGSSYDELLTAADIRMHDEKARRKRARSPYR